MMRFVRFSRSLESIAYEAPELSFVGNAFLPSKAFVPLQQNDGKPSMPIVNPGERVREGQLIARGGQPESVHVHAPVPGIVREFATIPLPNGKMGKAAVIELSGSFDILGRKCEHFPWKSVPESELLRVLEDKGVINTFDAPKALVPDLRKAKKIGKAALAIRLFDADPTCQLEAALMEQKRDMVLEGAAILAAACDAMEIFLIHNEKKWSGISENALEELFQKRTCHIRRASARYPSGSEGLIRSLVVAERNKAEINSNCVYVDTVTALSAYDAIVTNQPVVCRTIVVTGTALGRPEILTVRIGTPIGDVIEECGGFKSPPGRIVVNGLLSGTAVYDLDTPITKYTKSLHIMDTDACPDYAVTPCVHCGRCLQVCPAKIDPQRIVKGIDKAKHTPQLIESLKKCQYCGCCAIVCPSRIPLHQRIREACNRLTKGNAP